MSNRCWCLENEFINSLHRIYGRCDRGHNLRQFKRLTYKIHTDILSPTLCADMYTFIFFFQKLIKFIIKSIFCNKATFTVIFSPCYSRASRVRPATVITWPHHATVTYMKNFTEFLSASLYFSKRGAYWDRLCRDVVGCWLVGCHARALWPNGAS